VRSIKFSLDVTTEVIDAHQELVTHSYADEAEKRLVVEMDVRRAKWRKTLGLGHRTQIHWADVRTVDIKELSSFGCAIVYRLTYGDGWYRGKDGKREYFALQPHLVGIDLCRQCTTVAVRASILLAVMGGIGLRGVCWLMQMLFHLEVSKSALDRWVKECAAQLPGAAEMAKVLNSDKRVTEGHFDEIFAKGQRPKRCTLVLRDEHGRIFAAQEIDSRDEKTVTAFLKEVKGWGIAPKRFFVDGCEAYRKAIGIVFSDAVIQYDYFHVIQGIFKKLRRAFVSHRRDVKKRSEEVGTPWYAAKLEALAKKLWDKRGLIFKNPDKMTPEEQAELLALMDEDSFVDTLRHFMDRVWGIFRDSKGQLGARQRLGRLKQHEEVQRDSVEVKWTRRSTALSAHLPGNQVLPLAGTSMRWRCTSTRLDRGRPPSHRYHRCASSWLAPHLPTLRSLPTNGLACRWCARVSHYRQEIPRLRASTLAVNSLPLFHRSHPHPR
jgi:hypothetical protein